MKKIFTIVLLGLALLSSGCEKPVERSITEQAPSDFLADMGLVPEKAGERLPPLSYLQINGQSVDLDSYRGKVVFLNFWATWCLPCKKEMPDMEELHMKMKGKKFVILAISLREPKAKVTHFLRQFPYSFKIGMDPKNKIGKRLNVNALPTSLIIDKKGIIRAQAVGPRRWKDPKFVEYLTTLSNE